MTDELDAAATLDSRWQKEELFFSGDVFFDRVFSEAMQAQRSLDVETYIFENDAIGARAERALSTAARGGARVRLLVDGVGSRAWIGRWSAELIASGVEIRVYHPLWPFPSRYRERKGPRFRAGLFTVINRRNHRKTWTIDSHTAFVGSLNISASHSERDRGTHAWQDAAVRVEGPEISFLSTAFEYAWARSIAYGGEQRWLERFTQRPLQIPAFVRLNYTRHLRRKSFRDFLARLRSAKTRVWIANPYLVPSPFVLRAIRSASARGADVRVVVPGQSDVFFMRWVASSFYGALADAGARVYEYEPRFLHQKSLIIDDWATVGTSNMNTRSLLHDLEVDIVLTSPASLGTLILQNEGLCKAARPIGRERTWLRLFSETLGRVVAFVLGNWI